MRITEEQAQQILVILYGEARISKANKVGLSAITYGCRMILENCMRAWEQLL